MKHILSISSFFMASFVLFASTSTIASAQNVATGALTITTMNNWGSGGGEGMRIATSTPIINPNGCSRPTHYWLPETTSDISRSMILSAAATGAEIAFVIIGGACSDGDHPIIVNVAFPPA